MTLRYEVVPGTGLVARNADNIIWVGDQVQPPVWDALGTLLALQPGSAPDGADTAAQLEELAHILRQYPATTFAALIVAGDRAQGLMRGPVTVRNRAEVAPATGHSEVGITVPFLMSEAVYLGHQQATENHPAFSELLDLDAGVVPGSGAWVHPLPGRRRHSSSTATHAQPVPDSSTPPAAPNGPPAPPHTGAQPAGPPPVLQAASVGSWASPADPAGLAIDTAEDPGFTPAPDHERIDLRDLPQLGGNAALPVAQQPTDVGSPQAAASIGAMVFEDGSTFALDRDYIVGRRPEKDPRVQSGQAAALTIVDPDTVLSSAHALLALRGAQVLVTDLGSLNGTHIAPPAAQDWTRLQPHQEVTIVPGTRLLFGWTVATYSGTA